MPEIQRPLPNIPADPEELARRLPEILHTVLNFVAQQSTQTKREILADPRFSDMRVASGLYARENIIALDLNQRAPAGSVLTMLETNEGYYAAFVFPGTAPDGTLPAATPHNLLSTTHSDTTPSTPPALGSLLAGNGTTWEELGVGADGEVLTADSGDPLGVSWQPASGGNEFADDVWRVYDNGDNTKKIALEVSGVSAATTRTWTVQNQSGTVGLLEATGQVWTNENEWTLSQILAGISHSQSTPTPARPSSGKVKLFGDSGVGRVNLAQWREEGRMQWLQGNLGQCAARIIRPGTGTAPTVVGTSIGTVSGTASHPTVANTNFSTSIRRTQVLSATGAGSTGAIFEANLGVWIGNAAGLGGFYHCSKGILGVSSSSLGHFGFMGLRNSTTAMGATTPGTGATDLCGIGADSGDANYSIYHNDNGGNATKTPLDGTGGMPTIAVGVPVMLEMRIAPNGSTMYFRVTRLDDTTVAPAIYNSSTNLPRNSVFFAFHMNGYTNADGTQPVTLSLYDSYTECDN